ncbi:MAG: acyl-CoA thioesterase [Bacteroidetes bacterium]|nr:acyl-CoA thioesterase [Bacteroidota bacterium]
MFQSRISVRGYELDSYGHVNNAVFFNYFEQARWELFQKKGLLEELTARGLFLVVVEVHLRYQHEIKFGDEVEITTTVKKDNPFIIFEQRMKIVPGGQAAARARVKTVFVDAQRISHDIPGGIEPVFDRNYLGQNGNNR